jgi:hypothetical protein
VESIFTHPCIPLLHVPLPIPTHLLDHTINSMITIYKLGGGTFDISILEMQKGVQVKSPTMIQ